MKKSISHHWHFVAPTKGPIAQLVTVPANSSTGSKFSLEKSRRRESLHWQKMMPIHHYIWPNTHIDAGWAILWITTLSKLLGSRLTEKTINQQTCNCVHSSLIQSWAHTLICTAQQMEIHCGTVGRRHAENNQDWIIPSRSIQRRRFVKDSCFTSRYQASSRYRLMNDCRNHSWIN